MPFDHQIYFDAVRQSLFGGTLSQSQVDGMDAILTGWEKYADEEDMRWLGYMLATTFHETAQEMMPIEEYDGASQPYGQVDPETGQRYYGRGFVQITHRENYRRADAELNLTGSSSCEWHAENALLPSIAARTMYLGMTEGWFRSDGSGPQTLARYFSSTVEDPYGAREIINGDKTTVPDWAGGKSVGELIAGYYSKFHAALIDAHTAPVPDDDTPVVRLDVLVSMSAPVRLQLVINGEEIVTSAAALPLDPID